MKQLCYLSKAEKQNRWDDLCTSLDIVVTWYDIDCIQSLSAFVAREKTLHQQDYFLLDLEQQPWSNEHILSAIQMLRRFFVGRVLFFSPESNAEAKALYGALANQFHISGLFFEGEDMEERTRAFLENPEGGRLASMLTALREGVAAQADKAVSPLNIPRGLTLTVAVTGATPRCGTTTQTLALYHYLASLGFRPAILESSGSMGLLLDCYAGDCRRAEGSTELGSIRFCREPQEDCNAILVDVGLVDPQSALLRDADLIVVVGGAKPWELPHLAGALSRLRSLQGDRQLAALVSFSTGRELEMLGPILGTNVAPCSYHPELLTPSTPTPYQKAVLPCLKVLCGGGTSE